MPYIVCIVKSKPLVFVCLFVDCARRDCWLISRARFYPLSRDILSNHAFAIEIARLSRCFFLVARMWYSKHSSEKHQRCLSTAGFERERVWLADLRALNQIRARHQQATNVCCYYIRSKQPAWKYTISPVQATRAYDCRMILADANESIA
jgi:hypothetical protein